MNKVKAFFAKVANYIKNTAWIQPILIVIIIFVVLFSLNPITEAIKTGWTKLTTINKMEKITYAEYIEKVNDKEEMIVVFGQNESEDCPIFFKSMNEYLKESYTDDKTFNIYYVDLSVKSIQTKVDGIKYDHYKDKTLDLVNPTNGVKTDIIARDYVSLLDDRIDAFLKSFGSESYDDVTEASSNTIANSDYTYISTPLVIWYKDGIETRICNTFTSKVTLNSDGNKATPSTFRSFIENFGDGKNGTVKADNWDETFDLISK